jgi:hypothetical protein
MNLSLTRNDAPRRSQMFVYGVEGRSGSIRFSKGLFVNQTAPATLTLSDAAFAGPRVKETPAERKARRALITPAERLARMETRIAKMKAALAAPQPKATQKVIATPAPSPLPKANGAKAAKR